MPVLIRKIEANIIEGFIADVNMLTVVGEVGLEDYIKLGSFEGFLQNFSSVQVAQMYDTPAEFGLLRNKKEEFIELQISY